MRYLSNKESSKVGIVFGVIFLIIILALSNTIRTLFLNIDFAVFNFFGSFNFLVPFMRIITFFGNWQIIIPTGLMLALLVYKKDKHYAIISILTLIITQGVVFLLKEIFHRSRPPVGYIVANGFSFPSGHTTTSIIFYFLIAYYILNNYKSKNRFIIAPILVLLSFLICLSRLVLNVHWFSDVILGFLVALSIILISLSSYNELKR